MNHGLPTRQSEFGLPHPEGRGRVMIQTVARASDESTAHDHVWRRDAYDIRTNILSYACDLCLTTWAGVRVAPWRGHGREGLIRG